MAKALRSFSAMALVGACMAAVASPAMAAGFTAGAPASTQFQDIQSVPWAQEAIQRLVASGVIHGVSGTEYAPNQSITREQFAKLVDLNFGLDNVATPIAFQDVPSNKWSYSSIERATPYMDYYKTLSGNGFLFHPTFAMKREDLAIVLVKLLMAQGTVTLPSADQTASILAPYTDANELATSAQPYVAKAISIGLVKGYSATQIAPLDAVTRAQAAVFLDRIDQNLLVVPDLPAAQTQGTGTTSSPTGSTTGNGTGSSSTASDGNSFEATTGADSAAQTDSQLTANPGPNLHVVWNGYEGDIGSNVAVAGLAVVSADADSNGSIYAYDLTTGRKLWEYRQDDYYNGLLAGSPTTVLMTLGRNQQGVMALAASTGQPMWSQLSGASIVAMRITNGKAYVATSNGLYAFDAVTGEKLWSNSFQTGITALEVGNSQVAVGTSDGQIFGFAFNGNPVFNTKLAPLGVTGLSTSHDEWVVTQGNVVSAVNPIGPVDWSLKSPNAIIGGKAVVDGEAVYAVTNDQMISKIDLYKGTVLKTATMAFEATSAPAAANGLVYVTTAQGNLNTIDGDTLQSVGITSNSAQGGDASGSLNWYSTPLVYEGYVIGQSHMPGYSGDAEVRVLN